MKKNSFVIFCSVALLAIFGCSTDEKFSGSPVGNLVLTTLTGSITATGPIINSEVFALSGQKVEFTASLPEGKTFTDTVTVEVTTLRSDGGRVRDYFDVMPGQSSFTGKINSTGTVLFEGQVELFMSAIELQTVEPGIQYLMTSNRVSFKSGINSVGDPENDRLNISFVWEQPSPLNKVKVEIDRPVGSSDATATYGGLPSGIKHIIRTKGPGPGSTENSSQSFREGEYIFKFKTDAQTITEDKKYRIICVFPDGDVKVFVGTLFGWNGASSSAPVLKVTKTGLDENADFDVEQL